MTTVLLVAPPSDLPYARREAQDWLGAAHLEITPLIDDDVSVAALTRVLRGRSFDVLAFLTHGAPAGVMLARGELLPVGTLAQLARGRVAALFLNTCDSLAAAQMLQSECRCEVVCTVAAVDDSRAYTTGSLLAACLDAGASFAEAYAQSRPGGNRDYLYLAALPGVAAPNFRPVVDSR